MEKSTKEMSTAELLKILCGKARLDLASKPLPEVFGICTPRQKSLLACEEERGRYQLDPILAAAKELYVRALQEDMKEDGVIHDNPKLVTSYLCSLIGHYEHEVFICMWLDVKHRLIVTQELFRGTLTQTSVYPREVVKSALHKNAAAVIFAHNHPSGENEPSRADELLTTTLKSALALVDVMVLDHFVVAGNKALSFAEKGIL